MRIEEIKLEITNQCLLSCVHCSTNSRSKNPSSLSLPQLESLIMQAQALGSRTIMLSGGEPFLYPNLKQLLKIVAYYWCQSKIYTNGITQISPIAPVSLDQLLELKSLGLSHLVFSLFSHKSQRHDRITGVEGSFEATTSAIRNALGAGLRTEVHFVAMKPVIEDLLPLVEFLEKLGVRQISVLRFVPQGRGVINCDYLLPDTYDFVKLGQTLKSLLARKTGINCRIGSPFNFLLIKRPTRCNSGKSRMIIDSEGFAYPCDALKQFRMKGMINDNVSNNSLSEIIQRGQFFRLIRETPVSNECEGCVHVKQCLGGCLAQRCLTNMSQRDPACLLQPQRKSITHQVNPQLQRQEGIQGIL